MLAVGSAVPGGAVYFECYWVSTIHTVVIPDVQLFGLS